MPKTSHSPQTSPAKAEGSGSSKRKHEPFGSAVQLMRVRPKDDPHEREADRVAESVMRQAAGEEVPIPSVTAAAGAQRSTPGGDEDEPRLSAVASRAVADKGAGRPMDPGTQGTLEGSLGRDLSTVRVHDDTRANEAAKDLNARAFTHGKDIWLARGESDRDTKLMAHETAHVLQQGGGLSRKSEGKTGAKPAGGGSDPTKKKPKKKRTFGRMKLDASKTSVGTLEKPGTVRFPKIEIPKFKRHKHRGALYDKHRPLHRTKNYQRGNPNQRTVWRESMRMTQIQQALRDKAKKARRKKDAGELSDAGPHAFSIRVAGRDLFYLGSVQSVADELVFPKWGESGGRRQFRSFHVDHVVELQLAGWEAKKGGWANTKENFELLEGRANMASGHQIKQAIIGRAWAYIKSAYVKESDAEPDLGEDEKEDAVAAFKKRFHMFFEQAVGSGGSKVGRSDYWTFDEVQSAKHLAGMRYVPSVGKVGKDHIRVLSKKAGGNVADFHRSGELTEATRRFMAPFEVETARFDAKGAEDASAPSSGTIGSLTINIPEGESRWHRLPQSRSLPVKPAPGLPDVGYLEVGDLWSTLRQLRVKGASPILLDELDHVPGKGLAFGGRIVSDLPVFQNLEIGFHALGRDLDAYAEIRSEAIALPKPFTVTGSSLRIALGTESGLTFDGNLDFVIDGFGEGFVAGRVEGGAIALRGGFWFDSTLFDPAYLEVSYADGRFGIAGTLGIPSGKLKGIKSATLEARYTAGAFDARGDFELTIPGVEKGTLAASYGDDGRFAIEGGVELGKAVPGIESGSLRAAIARSPEGRWSIGGAGKAKPSIPGIDTLLEVTYLDGGFLVSGKVRYKHGRLDGTLAVGVTNFLVDPATDEPTRTVGDAVVVFGHGHLKLTLSKWLEGEAGVRFTPSGKLKVKGTLRVPKPIPLTKAFQWNKQLGPTLGMTIPVFGIPKIAAINVGIFGSLFAKASLGPAVLDNVAVTVAYDPGEESSLRAQGTARFYLPAFIGIESNLIVTVSAQVLIAVLGGYLQLGLGAGLRGEVAVPITIDWNPRDGLDISTIARVVAKPEVYAVLSGGLYVDLDLLLTTIRVWTKELGRKKYTFGSNLEFGIEAPVGYSERSGFRFDSDKVKAFYPSADDVKREGKRLLESAI